jgi:hypothetical protein
MRLHRRSFAAIVIVSCALGACGDDEPAATPGSGSTIVQATPNTDGVSVDDDSVGGVATQPASAGGDLDCEALNLTLVNIGINWQLTIGLTNSPSTEWAQIPLGSITEFGNQLAAATAALGGDGDAAAALSFMSGANDIVVRGLGGDSAAQADLTTYLGSDVMANVGRQLPISLAYNNLGCD